MINATQDILPFDTSPTRRDTRLILRFSGVCNAFYLGKSSSSSDYLFQLAPNASRLMFTFNVQLAPERQMSFSEAGIRNPDSHVRFIDKHAVEARTKVQTRTKVLGGKSHRPFTLDECYQSAQRIGNVSNASIAAQLCTLLEKHLSDIVHEFKFTRWTVATVDSF